MLSCDTSLHVHMGATCENVQLSNYISMRAYLKPVILDLGLSLTPIQTRQNQNPRRLELRDRDERSAMWPLQDKHRCLSLPLLDSVLSLCPFRKVAACFGQVFLQRCIVSGLSAAVWGSSACLLFVSHETLQQILARLLLQSSGL